MSVNAEKVLTSQFALVTRQFLEAACEVWPHDACLLTYKSFDFEDESAVKTLQGEFAALFSPFFGKLDARDDSILLEESLQPLFTALDAVNKWKNSTEDTRNAVWEYVKQMVQSATIRDVYAKCPPQMMNKVATMADSIVKGLENGSLDLSKINPVEMSKQMLEGMDPKEIEVWANSIMKDGNMESMMRLMTSAMGGGNVAGMPMDPSMIASMMDPKMMGMLGNLFKK